MQSCPVWAPTLKFVQDENTREVCPREGYLQHIGNYCRVRHYQGRTEYGKSKFYYHQQSSSYIKSLTLPNVSRCSEKTLIKVRPNDFAEVSQVGVQAKHRT